MKIYDFDEFAASDQFGVGEPNTAYAEFFDGQSYLNPINDGGIRLVNVTFEPGCRTHWHVHKSISGGEQQLICTAGEGLYRERDKDPIALHPGMVIIVPPGVEHWHGARPDSWFSHIILDIPGDGCETEWHESVSDEEYAL